MMQASPFINAMDSTNNLVRGEKGAAEHTARGVEEPRVALFFALVRTLPAARLAELMQLLALEDANERPQDQSEIIADMFLMAFQTRHCRGGKGERDLFYKMIMELVVLFPQTVESLMVLVPSYGSFKDWFQLIALATSEKTDATVKLAMVPIVNTIMELSTDQLLQDRAMLDEMEWQGSKTSGISLLAKWAPREKKQFKNQVQVLANKLFPESKAPKKEYRQLLSRLNVAIHSPEVGMSANQWDQIDFNKVPSICLLKHRKALLNEKLTEPPYGPGEEETGNRHPENEKRVQCRKRLRDAMLQSTVQKLKGRQLFPHEIVQKIMNGRNRLSTLEKELFSCQWDDIRASVISAMEGARKKKVDVAKESNEPASSGVDLGKIVPLVDVSGSMSGTPMEVAIALGILVSEVASPAFANRCLTFSADPTWVELEPSMTLAEKVMEVQRADWGMNTNFEKATEKILEVAIKAKLEPDDIPDLIVFSDMQFDEARNDSNNWESDHERRNRSNDWESHHERIVRRFKEEGVKACGKEWPAPHIVYWNLRGDTNGIPAQSHTPNVTMLAGYSPSLMKLLMDGDPLDDDEMVDGDDNDGSRQNASKTTTPFVTVRRALDDEDYNKVRKVLSESSEGLLRFYKASEDAMADPVPAVVKEDAESKEDWELVNY